MATPPDRREPAASTEINGCLSRRLPSQSLANSLIRGSLCRDHARKCLKDLESALVIRSVSVTLNGMTLQRSHGRSRPQAPRPDEVPAGVPESARAAAPRGPRGRLQSGTGTSALASKGGLAAKQAREWRKLLGLADVPLEFAPYIKSAEQIREGILRDLASDVGGGQVSSIVAMLVSLAARAKAMSLLCQDAALAADGETQIALLDRADKFGTTARGHLIAAREIAAKDAQARAKRRRAPDPSLSTVTPADVRRIFKLDTE